jgi:hypothetical protein
MRDHLPDCLRDTVSLQEGIVTRQQALAAGLSRDAIKARLDGGRWQRLHPGIYAVFTGEPSRRARLWAAVLYAGRDAMLSHQTAAEADGLDTRRGAIHVTVPAARTVRAASGMVIHRRARAGDIRHPSRLPPRPRIEETVLDLAAAARSYDEAYGWLCRACADRLTTPGKLREAMAGRRKLRWRQVLAACIDEIAGGVFSGLELRYLRNVERAHGLPVAARQAKATSNGRNEYRDILYRDYGVAVETDGRAAHPVSAWPRDAARDNAAAARGLVTLRYPWRPVTSEPCRVAAEVAAALRHRGWQGSPRRCGPGCPAVAIFLGILQIRDRVGSGGRPPS